MKGGTSTLYELLSKHPQIFMSPVKEPNFFAYIGGRPERTHPPGLPYPVWTIDTPDVAEVAMEMKVNAASFTTRHAYERLWQDAKEEQRGEASVLYLYLPDVAEKIASIKPDIKLIAILRDPIERAYSHFQMARRMGREPQSDFVLAMNDDRVRRENNYDPFWLYESFGYYYLQLERYLNCFDPAQIMIVLNEDLRRDNKQVLQRILRFLNVDDSFEPDSRREYGIGGIPRNQKLYRFLNRPSIARSRFLQMLPGGFKDIFYTSFYKRLVMSKPALDVSVRRHLVKRYIHDIENLEDLISRDLSDWKS
jgi:hypothetical protein